MEREYTPPATDPKLECSQTRMTKCSAAGSCRLSALTDRHRSPRSAD